MTQLPDEQRFRPSGAGRLVPSCRANRSELRPLRSKAGRTPTFQLALLFFWFVGGPGSTCGQSMLMESGRLAEDYLAVREARRIASPGTLAGAWIFQKNFVQRLVPTLGKPVGYKVGLVSREAQERFKINTPVRGVLLEQMLLPDRSGVPPGFAVRPIFEADLIVVVKDKAINDAESVFDVAENLKEVIAFIELPDNYMPTNNPIDGATLMAGNVGARLGVIGNRMPFEPTQRFIEGLANMTVTITDQTGAELGRGQGKAILDQPLNAVLWLIEEMEKTGDKLKPGEYISLGTIKTIPYPAGKTVTVRYEGLPRGTMRVSATLP